MRSDVYSLGLILAQLSRSFRRVARKCCEPKPWRRYASAAEVKKALHSRWPVLSGMVFILAVFAIVLTPYAAKWLGKEEAVVVPADTITVPPADTLETVPESPARSTPPVKQKEAKPVTEATVDEAAIDELFRQATDLFD